MIMVTLGIAIWWLLSPFLRVGLTDTGVSRSNSSWSRSLSFLTFPVVVILPQLMAKQSDGACTRYLGTGRIPLQYLLIAVLEVWVPVLAC